MDLKAESEKISARFEALKGTIEKEKKELERRVEESKENLSKAYELGDLRENAEFEAALASCTVNNYSLNIKKQQLEEMLAIDTAKGYFPIGAVIMFSTVRLTTSLDDKEYVFKLYPKGVSDLPSGILSVDSVVGREVMNKRVGDMFITYHRVTGKKITWKVEEIY